MEDGKLAIAIWAAAIAVAGNAAVDLINGYNQQQLERTRLQNQLVLDSSKAESERILAMIRTNDPDAAASNLKFLLETALIDDGDTATGLIRYLHQRRPGEGIALPTGAEMDARPASGQVPVKSTVAMTPKAVAASRMTSPQADYLLTRYRDGLKADERRPFVTLKYIMQDQRSAK